MIHKTGSLEIPPINGLIFFVFKIKTFKVYDFLKLKYVNKKRGSAKTKHQQYKLQQQEGQCIQKYIEEDNN